MNPNIPSRPLQFKSKKFEKAFDNIFNKKAKRKGGIDLTIPKGNKKCRTKQ